MNLRWAHERTILQTIVLEHALIRLCDSEGLETPFVLQLETRLSRAILDGTEDLNEQARVLDDTATTTHLLILNVKMAVLALVLNLDKLDVGDEAKDFDDVADDLISRDRLDQLNLVARLEISHLILYLPNDLEIGAAKHQLGVDVDRDGDLTHGILD